LATTALAESINTSTASQAATTSAELFDKYQQIKDQLANSIFGEPILLHSKTGSDYAQGEVYVLLASPFSALRSSLSQTSKWCELTILHVNIKTCTYQHNALQLYVGRKHYETPDQAFPLQYRFESPTNSKQQLHVKLTAPEGPFGTSDYLISLNAIPIDAQHSFVHFKYRYQFGFVAKMAMQTYLATLGSNKIGFTILGADENGEAIYVKGLQGVIERNVMRYIFAIQTLLENQTADGEDRYLAQLLRWHTYIQQHPRQLLELSNEEYVSNKQRERKNQRLAQEELQP